MTLTDAINNGRIAPPAHPPHVPTETIVAHLVMADGNLHLASERIYGTPEHAPRLLDTIAADPTIYETLVRQLKVKALITAYRDMNTLQSAITDAIATFEPADMVRAYKALVDLFTNAATLTPSGQPAGGQYGSFSTTQTFNLNVMDKVIQALPPDVQTAVRTLMESPQASPPAAVLPGPGPNLLDTNGRAG